MALTKAHPRMVTGVPLYVDDYIPAGTNTLTTDCTAFIQAAIDDAATDNGRSVFFSAKTYRIDSTVQIKTHSTNLIGNGCTLDYYGSDVAVDFIPVSGTIYPVSCHLQDVFVRIRTAVSGTGFHVRASYSEFVGCGVSIEAAASSARGFVLLGDEANGTGPYYNTFVHCRVQSQSGSTDHIGISFVASAPSYRAPNANTFIGGRVGQCAQGIVIKGAGNTFFNPTVENNPATGTSITFEADTATNCVNNNVFGAYLENAATGILFKANSAGNSVYSFFGTGLATEVSDLGSQNSVIRPGRPAQFPNGVKLAGAASSDAEVLDDYEEGTWTATILGGTTAGTYEIGSQLSTYTKTGNVVCLNTYITMAGSLTGGGSGSLYIGGLPFAKGASKNAVGSVRLSGVNLTAGAINLACSFPTNSVSSQLYFAETLDGLASAAVPITAITAGNLIVLSITYMV